jgi:hypothetical protein
MKSSGMLFCSHVRFSAATDYVVYLGSQALSAKAGPIPQPLEPVQQLHGLSWFAKLADSLNLVIVQAP